MNRAVRKLFIPGLLLAFAVSMSAQDLASFEKRTTVKKLDNGLTVIVLERPEAPVFSFATVVNVGAAQEVPGITGLAHMFEHEAFKGTDKVGTSNFEGEKAALQKVEDAYAAYDRARRDPINHDAAKIAELEKGWKSALDDANKFVVPNEFSKIIDKAGAVGVNAFTASDETVYFYSMPSNRFELWAYLESGRHLHPSSASSARSATSSESGGCGRRAVPSAGARAVPRRRLHRAHTGSRSSAGRATWAFSATDAIAFFKNTTCRQTW